MRSKEPKFMSDLHKIRENLAKKWSKMNPEKFLDSLHDSGRWLKAKQIKKVLH